MVVTLIAEDESFSAVGALVPLVSVGDVNVGFVPHQVAFRLQHRQTETAKGDFLGIMPTKGFELKLRPRKRRVAEIEVVFFGVMSAQMFLLVIAFGA